MNTPNPTITGIHHVTAITADAQANVDFYSGLLGLRLVKLTVNFDDPSSYHLYYGDHVGSPGTIMTFFAWPGGRRGRVGLPQVTATAFAIPHASVDFWAARLRDRAIRAAPPTARSAASAAETVITFTDPDGLPIELVASSGTATSLAHTQPHPADGIPIEHAIRGIHGITACVEAREHSARVMTDLLGYRLTAESDNRARFESSAGGPGAIIDFQCLPGGPHGSMGTGVVHHVAIRAVDDAQQAQWRSRILAARLNVSPVMDRNYFHSIYFREPGGILLEIATDPPGFTADEPVESLGHSLRLPAWMEYARPRIVEVLPRITVAGGKVLP